MDEEQKLSYEMTLDNSDYKEKLVDAIQQTYLAGNKIGSSTAKVSDSLKASMKKVAESLGSVGKASVEQYAEFTKSSLEEAAQAMIKILQKELQAQKQANQQRIAEAKKTANELEKVENSKASKPSTSSSKHETQLVVSKENKNAPPMSIDQAMSQVSDILDEGIKQKTAKVKDAFKGFDDSKVTEQLATLSNVTDEKIVAQIKKIESTFRSQLDNYMTAAKVTKKTGNSAEYNKIIANYRRLITNTTKKLSALIEANVAKAAEAQTVNNTEVAKATGPIKRIKLNPPADATPKQPVDTGTTYTPGDSTRSSVDKKWGLPKHMIDGALKKSIEGGATQLYYNGKFRYTATGSPGMMNERRLGNLGWGSRDPRMVNAEGYASTDYRNPPEQTLTRAQRDRQRRMAQFAERQRIPVETKTSEQEYQEEVAEEQRRLELSKQTLQKFKGRVASIKQSAKQVDEELIKQQQAILDAALEQNGTTKEQLAEASKKGRPLGSKNFSGTAGEATDIMDSKLSKRLELSIDRFLNQFLSILKNKLAEGGLNSLWNKDSEENAKLNAKLHPESAAEVATDEDKFTEKQRIKYANDLINSSLKTAKSLEELQAAVEKAKSVIAGEQDPLTTEQQGYAKFSDLMGQANGILSGNQPLPGAQTAKQYEAAGSKVKQSLDKIKQAATTTFLGIDNEAKKSSNNVVKYFKSVSRIVSGIVISQMFYRTINAFQQASSAIAQFTMDMDDAKTSFEVMLGTAGKANKMLYDLEDLAAKTPYTMQTAREGALQLKAMGFAAQEILPTMKALSDMSAITGGDQGKIDSLVRALGQIKVKGKLASEEMRQLYDAGVPAADIMQKALNINRSQLDKALRSGSIQADQAINAILQGIEERFGGSAEKLAKSVRGRLSTIKDMGLFLGDQLFGGLNERFKDFLGKVVDSLTKYRAVARSTGGGGLFEALIPKDMQGTIRTLIGYIGALGAAFKSMLVSSGVLKYVLFGMLQGAAVFIKPLALALNTVAITLQRLTKDAPIVAALLKAIGTALSIGMLMSATAALGRLLLNFSSLIGLSGLIKNAGILIGAAFTYMSKGALLSETAIKGLNGAMLFLAKNPIVIIVTAIAGALFIVGKYADQLIKKFARTSVALQYLLVGAKLFYEVIEGIFKGIDSLLGLNIGKILQPVDVQKDMEDYSESISTIGTAADDAADSVDNLKNSIMSFDEVFNMDDQSGGIGGNISAPFNLDPVVATGTTPAGPDADMGYAIDSKVEDIKERIKKAFKDFFVPIALFFKDPPNPPSLKQIVQWVEVKFKAIKWPTIEIPEGLKNFVLPAPIMPQPIWPAITVPDISAVVSREFDEVLNVISTSVQKQQNVVDISYANILSTILQTMPMVSGNISTEMQLATNSVSTNCDTLAELFNLNVPIANLNVALNAIRSGWSTLSTDVYTTNSNLLEDMFNDWVDLGNKLATKATEIKDGIVDALSGINPGFQSSVDLMPGVLDSAKSPLLTVAQSIADVLGTVFDGIIARAASVLDEANAAITAANADVDQANEALNTAEETRTKAKGVIDYIKDALNPVNGVLPAAAGGSMIVNEIRKRINNASAIPGFATGGIVSKEQIIRVAEGNKREGIIPLEGNAMAPFAKAIAAELGTANGVDSQPIMYVGTLIADDRSLTELERRMQVIRINETRRRG
jgi:tape measure domain-containing protein